MAYRSEGKKLLSLVKYLRLYQQYRTFHLTAGSIDTEVHMPYANSDGVKLFYEESGSGTAILFIHEFAGDHRSWEPVSYTHLTLPTILRV